MLDPRELLLSGDTEAALSALTDQVRADPADSAKRVALFQLLALEGAWERSGKQLGVLDSLDADLQLLAQAYSPLLTCELFRQEVFQGQRDAAILGEPEQWMVHALQALKSDAAGAHDSAQTLRDAAFDEAPAVSGHIDGVDFEWIADADTRIGPFFEMMVRGHYYWVPHTRLQKLTFEAPEDVRDLIWAPVSVVWSGGGEEVGFVPARYPGDVAGWTALQKMARETAWNETSPGCYAGLGQRLLVSSEDDHPLLEIRELEFSKSSAD